MAYRKVTRYVPGEDGTRIAYHTHLGVDPDIADEAALRGRPAVLLTSGIGTTENFWRYLVETLTAEHRVVHWDYRGHGSSDTAKGGDYSFATQVDDLERVTREAISHGDGRTPPLHVAFSMGVSVLLELYRRSPQLVPAMVLVAGAAEAPGTGALPFRIPGTLAALRRGMRLLTPAVPTLAPAVFAFIASPLLYPLGRLTGVLRQRAPRSDIEHFMRELGRMDPMAFWQTLQGLMAVDATSVLPTISVPVLIVAPTHDLMMPVSQVEKLHRAIPGAQLIKVEDAGHAGLLEAGTEVATAIREFLRPLAGG